MDHIIHALIKYIYICTYAYHNLHSYVCGYLKNTYEHATKQKIKKCVHVYIKNNPIMHVS